MKGEGNIDDLSMFGMKVTFQRNWSFKPGDVLSVRFQVPNTDAMVSTSVEVVRKESPSVYGVKFIRICADVLDGIRAHLTGH